MSVHMPASSLKVDPVDVTEPAEPSRLAPPSRLRLRQERLRLGLTQGEVAEALAALAWSSQHERLGVDAMMVSKWERGLKCPRRSYRRLFCLLYGRTEEELGFRAAAVTRPDLTGDDVNRREFLKGAALLGLAATNPFRPLDELTHLLHHPAIDPGTVAAFDAVVEGQRRIYWTAPPRPLFDAAAAHAQLGLDLLRSGGGSNRPALARSVAHCSLIAGRLAFFDLAEPRVARRCFDIARDLADEAGDRPLRGAIFGHMAFLPGFSGDLANASAALVAAEDDARHAGPQTRAWLRCVRAEISARNGAAPEALAGVLRAEDDLDAAGSDPEWLDFFDASRLAGFTGYVQLLAGDHRAAVETLEGPGGHLPASAVKQRSVWLLDRACAHAPGDAHHALSLAGEAVENLHRHWYPTATDRVPALRSAFAQTGLAGQLEETLRPLYAMAS